MAETILQLRGITKIFPGVKALNNVQFDLKAGEIHALMGENGAGKSTFVEPHRCGQLRSLHDQGYDRRQGRRC